MRNLWTERGQLDRKLKVIHIITMLELGGAQGNTLFTVANLDKSKFEVGLITGPGGILDEEARNLTGVRVTFVPPLIRSVHPIKDALALFALTRILRKEKPDIVHTHSSKAGILGRLAAKMAGVPTIIHSIHGFGFNPYQKVLAQSVFVFLEKRMARFTTVLIAVAQENIKAGLRLGIGRPNLYRLIRSGVDIEKIRQNIIATDSEALQKELGI